MSESATPSQRDQELRELRARAYGPHPDIQDDPEALARLAELESVRLDEHASAGPGEHASQEPVRLTPETVVVIEAPMPDAMVAGSEPVQPRSAWQKVWATPTGRVWLIGGSLVVIIAVIYAVTWFAPQRPEATLQPTGIEVEGQLGLGWGAPDRPERRPLDDHQTAGALGAIRDPRFHAPIGLIAAESRRDQLGERRVGHRGADMTFGLDSRRLQSRFRSLRSEPRDGIDDGDDDHE